MSSPTGSAFQPPRLVVWRVSPEAKLPEQTPHSVGYELSSCSECVIQSKCRMFIRTGLVVSVPHGTYGRLVSANGMALQHGVDVMGSVFNSNYQGEVAVVLVNLGSSPFFVKVGDVIAQLILERIEVNAVVHELGKEEVMEAKLGS